MTGQYFYDYVDAMEGWDEGKVWNVGKPWMKNRFVPAKFVLDRLCSSDEKMGYTSIIYTIVENGRKRREERLIPYAYDWFFHIWGPEADVRKTLKTPTLQHLIAQNANVLGIDVDTINAQSNNDVEAINSIVTTYMDNGFVYDYYDFAPYREELRIEDENEYRVIRDEAPLPLLLTDNEVAHLNFIHDHILKDGDPDGLLAKSRFDMRAHSSVLSR